MSWCPSKIQTALLPAGAREAHGVANNGADNTAYLGAVLDGLARTGFKNIVVINGHGGPQTAILNELAEMTGREPHVRPTGTASQEGAWRTWAARRRRWRWRAACEHCPCDH